MLIEMKRVRKVYPMGETPVVALDGIDLEIDTGDFVAIIGSSGSGKTSLLDVLGCLSRPTAGDYFLKGSPVANLDDRALSRIRNQTLGFIFQTFHLLGKQTAQANVEVPLFYSGVARAHRTARAREALARVGLADRMHHRPGQLSGGQQQRVAIARALVNCPDVLLADEPTGNLDSKSGEEIMRLLLDLHREGRTLILVTHDPSIAAIAPRCVTLKDGRILHDRSGSSPL